MVRFGRSKVSAGLDIGSGFVKLVVIDHSKPEPEIVQVATSPLVPDAIVEGEIMDPVLVTDTIRSLVESAGLKKAEVVSAVGAPSYSQSFSSLFQGFKFPLSSSSF